ncbi:MAG TPA: methyltransferase domain-containing protein [Acidimicrobiales bacterium]|nr:methyltransferase domain-containing protein [Acidimicrobiales bacterium]
MTVQLRLADGDTRRLTLEDWYGAATTAEVELLRMLRGPVLDLGCGPGRLVVALNELGTPALGIDASPNALGHAAARGAAALHRSVFDPLPGEGRWATVLLFDGNIGIGGDPIGLLRRVAHLLGPDGRAVVEVDSTVGPARTVSARLEQDGELTAWFPWAIVTADAIDGMAEAAGLIRCDATWIDERCFVTLTHRLVSR